MSSISDLLLRFKNEKSSEKCHIELEIRFKEIDKLKFMKTYNYLDSQKLDKKYSFTINTIVNNKKEGDFSNLSLQQKIREIKFDKTKSIKDDCHKKEQLLLPFRGDGYIISLSKEEIIPNFIISNDKIIIRIKKRVSFVYGKWSIDLTVIKSMSGSEVEQLRENKNKMFSDEQLDTYSDCTYEIEAELLDTAVQQNDIDDVVSYVSNIIIPKGEINLLKEINYISKFLNRTNVTRLKNLLPQVISLTRNQYKDLYPPINFYITDKADGKRAIVSGLHGAIISDVVKQFERKSLSEIILDGELIGDKFYAFDVIVYNDNNLTKLSFEERISYLQKAVDDLQSVSIPVFAKTFVKITENLKSDIQKIYETKKEYKKDGLIFIQDGNSYQETISYKWKSINDNTIDFLVKNAPKSYSVKYLLFVGIRPDVQKALGLTLCDDYNLIFPNYPLTNYFPIQFSPCDRPEIFLFDSDVEDLDGKIVEMVYTTKWEVVKIRDDRQLDLESGSYFGNDFKSAELTWVNYIDPFPIEELWNGTIMNDYFVVEKAGIYVAQIKVISYMKNKRILSDLHNANYVVDVACGKGQDLKRYYNAHVKHLLAIDQDRSALSEFIRRKYEFIKQGDYSTMINIMVANINDVDFVEKIRKIYPNKVNGIVCNLAIHYFKNVNIFINIVDEILDIGGIVIITCMVGKSIHDLFMSNGVKFGKSFDLFEKSKNVQTLKYSLKRLYQDDVIQDSNQQIGVLLPFSDGKYYDEYLVNQDYLINSFKQKNITLESHNLASDFIKEFEVQNRRNSILTTEDKQYLSLYGEFIFRKQ